jgi:hypothetical protein
MSIHKDIIKLIDLAEEQGWTVEHTSKHIRFHPPDGSEYYMTSRTPSDAGIIRTIRNDLKKRGLFLSRTEWKREQKAKLESFKLPPNPADPGDRTEVLKTIARLSDAEVIQFINQTVDVSALTSWQLANMVNMVRNVDGHYQDCICGARFVETFGLYMHVAKGMDSGGHAIDTGRRLDPDALAEAPDQPESAPETSGSTTHSAPETALESPEKADEGDMTYQFIHISPAHLVSASLLDWLASGYEVQQMLALSDDQVMILYRKRDTNV